MKIILQFGRECCLDGTKHNLNVATVFWLVSIPTICFLENYKALRCWIWKLDTATLIEWAELQPNKFVRHTFNLSRMIGIVGRAKLYRDWWKWKPRSDTVCHERLAASSDGNVLGDIIDALQNPFRLLKCRCCCWWKEFRPQAVHVHPGWTGDILDGHDVALLQLKRKLAHNGPDLVSPSFDLNPNDIIFTFRWSAELQYANFTVVKSDVFSMVASSSPKIFISVGDVPTCEGGWMGTLMCMCVLF